MLFDTSKEWPSSIFNAIVAPRPIGWISTCDAAGNVNLAPFSYFNAISATPPMVVFACNAPADRKEKDTLANVRATGEFCANLASFDLRHAMNTTSATVATGTDEFELAGLQKAANTKIRTPRVAASPAALECVVIRIVDLMPESPRERHCGLVIGRVVAVHVADEYLTDAGRFDSARARPLARLGGYNYTAVESLFEMGRPDAK
ncbi:MAG TPA: flavin reductase family protein [Ramlibacter sp.]|uniref:flavin reductase family protein n=1 Tax=Ramlibacter sp. TaxID=1917967 RepID=UPI002CCFA1EB|nr:flavin reductase family protein [Ramlibacter sp.]HVZ46532.1 flavin reductase family protein [Ramlibacter sp.]